MSSRPTTATASPSRRTGDEVLDGLAEEVLSRADTLANGDDLSGIRLDELTTLDDFLDHVWRGWRLVQRRDVGGNTTTGATCCWAIVLLRHATTGIWLTTAFTMSYSTREGQLFNRWEDSMRRSRLTTVAFHVFGLGKFTHAATLPVLAERLAAEIEPRLGPLNRSAELDRHIRTARALLTVEPDAAAAAVDEADAADVRHQSQSLRTLAALGALGGIEAVLAQAAEENPDL